MISNQAANSPIGHSSRHAELLDVLEHLVKSEGFGDLGVGEIARRLKCSRSTLYAIAPSKEQLFITLVDRILGRIQAAASMAAQRESDPAIRLEAFLAGGLDQIRGVGMKFIEEMQAHAAARARLAEFQRTFISQLRILIDEGIEAGVFQPVNSMLAAELLDAAATRIQDSRVLHETGLTPSEAFADVFQVITRGLVK